jgi:adenine-specific DNA-methyltransferase
MAKKPAPPKTVETLTHDADKRKNIPTAEFQSVLKQDEQHPVRVAYERRNRDLDPQLVWRGKDEQDWSDLVVHAPPLYIQEKVHPKVLIDDLLKQTQQQKKQGKPVQLDLFADFNGIPEGADKTDFYQHDQNWSNRMILGDSLQVMASLAEREGLRGKVQCIYLDPPYGIKFNSNFQWSTTSRDVKDGKADHITREPEQVKAFRDTWRDGIHSYLTYLRDRLTVARDLLTDSGSIFVQIGDENVHRVRAVMDEVFGDENYVIQITFATTGGFETTALSRTGDNIIWYCKDKERLKYRQLFLRKEPKASGGWAHNYLQMVNCDRRPLTRDERQGKQPIPDGARLYMLDNLVSQGASPAGTFDFELEARKYHPGARSHWKTRAEGMRVLVHANRIEPSANQIRYVRFFDDFAVQPLTNDWDDTTQAGYVDDKVYVVQTVSRVIERCILMTTDPGDLVLDPTCGSGTTAHVAEQWGRRWITIDTSRVALALARARIMGARYPYYLLADSRDGQIKEAEITGKAPSSQPVRGNIRQGFVYERVPHVTLKSIANNAEIDVIWDQWQAKLEPLREMMKDECGRMKKKPEIGWEEWEVPREAGADWSAAWKKLHADWWAARIGRQKEIDASIAAKAEFEYLYDKPYPDNKKVRVAGPFTVESLSPHRVLGVDETQGRGPQFRPDDSGEPQDRRRAAGAQGRPDHLHGAHPLARRIRLRRRPLPATPLTPTLSPNGRGSGCGETGRRLHWPGVRDGPATRPGEGRPRGGRRWFRCADRLRLQLRSPYHGVQQARPHPRAEGAHERRPAHGRRPQEHGQGQSLHHLRRAGHRPSAGEERSGAREGERRGRIPPQHRRSPQRRPRRHRLLVHRHRLQR